MTDLILNLFIIEDEDYCILYSKEKNSIFRCKKSIGEEVRKYQKNEKFNPEVIRVLNEKINKKIVHSPTHSIWKKSGILDKCMILVTNSCNLRCKYCYANYGKYGKDNQKESVLSSDKIKDIFSFFEKNKVKRIREVIFFCGEPFLGIKAIREICEKFQSEYNDGFFETIPNYSLITNLTMNTSEIVEVINRYNISMTVSIDGPKEVNDLQRVDMNGKGSFQSIEHNFSVFRENIKGIEATYTKNHENINMTSFLLKKYLSEHFNMEMSKINIVPVSDCNDLEGNRTLFDETDISATVEDNYILSAFDEKYQSDLFCNAGCNRLCVTMNGDLYPCQMFVGRESSKLGSIYSFENYEEKLDKIIIKKNEHKSCNNCWASKFCRVCPAQVLRKGKNEVLNFQKCNQRRYRYEQIMKQACRNGGNVCSK